LTRARGGVEGGGWEGGNECLEEKAGREGGRAYLHVPVRRTCQDLSFVQRHLSETLRVSHKTVENLDIGGLEGGREGGREGGSR